MAIEAEMISLHERIIADPEMKTKYPEICQVIANTIEQRKARPIGEKQSAFAATEMALITRTSFLTSELHCSGMALRYNTLLSGTHCCSTNLKLLQNCAPNRTRSVKNDHRNAEALALITNAGKAGVTYNELRERHLHGTPVILIKLGMIHRERRNRSWIYVANRTAATR